MRKIKQQLFVLALALWAFSSCSQDSSDMQGSITGGESVTFSLSAEVSVDDSDIRAINYKLGMNAKSQLVPLPQFVDKQEVEVHTILKSSRAGSTPVAKTLKWRYDATKKKLVLKQTDGHSFTVSDFNNEDGVKWYISGLIGGALNGTKVEFMGTRVLKGVDGNAGDALGSMEVPYAFGWTELTINTKSTKESPNSYKYAEVPRSESVQFKPLGSMLAVKLGTNQRAGAYSFTPKGFTLSSNAWYDQGSFDLDTAIPTTNPHTALPAWTEGLCAGTMYYTFASGEEPGAIAHGQTTAKTYYVWVMPHKAVPAGAADVRVMLKGMSSRPATETYKDYTNTWFTDYSTEGKETEGKVTQGKIHALTAKVTRRVALPIEYVTEHNLAGGEGLTYTIASGTETGHLNSPALEGIEPKGVQGDLRFASSHGYDQTGYYNWYKVVGRHDGSYNPDGANLQTEIDKAFGPDNYFIPSLEQWWGVYPSSGLPWDSSRDRPNEIEEMGVGQGGDILRQAYLSDYSKVFTSPLGGSNDTDNVVRYAIRFKARTNDCSPRTRLWNYDTTIEKYRSYTYTSARDNSFKCAYRFRRVGGKKSWQQNDNTNKTNQLVIDVVYLGEEVTPTPLSVISDEAWWSTKELQAQVFSVTFPANGYIYGSPGTLVDLGVDGSYWSTSVAQVWQAAQAASVNYSGLNSFTPVYMRYGLPVRLFKGLGL